MTREFHSHPFGRVAVEVVVDLHRAARQPEHGKRNGRKRKMIIQHHAEETRDQYLVEQRGEGQYEDREIIAAWNSGECLQDIALNEILTDPRVAAGPVTLDEIS